MNLARIAPTVSPASFASMIAGRMLSSFEAIGFFRGLENLNDNGALRLSLLEVAWREKENLGVSDDRSVY
jgi:hypothetical protein